MIERRKEQREKKNFVLSDNIVNHIQNLAAKYGISEAAVVSMAVVQLVDREREEKSE